MNKDLIIKAGGFLIRDKKLLLNKQGGSDVYIVPGGQIEPGETSRQALVRELEEEFGLVVVEESLEELGTFDSPAVHHPGRVVRITAFLVNGWEGEIQIKAEIEGVKWVNSQDVKEIKVSPFTKDVAIPILFNSGVID